MSETSTTSTFEKVFFPVFAIILAAMFAFLGYIVVTHEPDTVQSTRRERFTLVDIDPPKHFYVSLRDSSGKLHEKVYVSKHCNAWKSLKIGQDLDLDINTYAKPASRGGTTYETIMTGNNKVCPVS